MATDGGTKCLFSVGLIVLGIGVLLTVILVPMSFAGLDYYEYGFKRSKSTGTVNTEKVYGFGKYMVGPDYEFKTFPATSQLIGSEFTVYTKDKLEITITVYFQYFLRQEDLPILHKLYDVNYHPTIRTTAISAMKIEAPRYYTLQFINQRKLVEESLFRVVREKLGGRCCAKDCDSWDHACPDGCLEADCDQERDKGLWVDVKYFQLGEIDIPDDVSDRYLKALTLQEDVEREKNYQDAAVVRKGTGALVAEINNQAKEVKQIAEAESQKLQTISQANYTATVEKARSQGLKMLYERLNIKDQSTKNSFDYLRTLRGLDHAHFTVDFQQRIAGNL